MALIASALVATATRGAWLGALAGFAVRRLPRLGRGLAGFAAQKARGRRARRRRDRGDRRRHRADPAEACAGAPRTLSSLLARLSNGRTVIWLTGLRAWLTHPITGWGPDGFGRAFESAGRGGLVRAGRGPPAGRERAQLPRPDTRDTRHPGTRADRVGARVHRGRVVSWSAAGEGSCTGAARGALGGAHRHDRRADLRRHPAGGVGVAVADRRLAPGPDLAPRGSVPLPKAVLARRRGLGVVLALWAGSWLVADVIGRAGDADGSWPGSGLAAREPRSGSIPSRRTTGGSSPRRW